MIHSIILAVVMQPGPIQPQALPTYEENVAELVAEIKRRGMKRVIVVPSAITGSRVRTGRSGRPVTRGEFKIGDALGIVNLLGGGGGGFPGGGFPGGGFPGGGFPGGGFPGGGFPGGGFPGGGFPGGGFPGGGFPGGGFPGGGDLGSFSGIIPGG